MVSRGQQKKKTKDGGTNCHTKPMMNRQDCEDKKWRQITLHSCIVSIISRALIQSSRERTLSWVPSLSLRFSRERERERERERDLQYLIP